MENNCICIFLEKNVICFSEYGEASREGLAGPDGPQLMDWSDGIKDSGQLQRRVID